MLDLSDVLGLEGEPTRLRLRVLRERDFETQSALVFAGVLQRVDEKEVVLCGREDPAAVCRHVDADDCIAKGWQRCLRADAETVEEPDVAVLSTDGDVAFFCG